MSALLKLSELSINQSATVHTLPKSGATALRLREMGMLAGTRVTLVRTAPLGDPLEIKIRGYSLTLRKREAAEVLVETLAAAAG